MQSGFITLYMYHNYYFHDNNLYSLLKVHAMFFPACVMDSGPISLHCWFYFLWDWGGASGFDVDTGSTQNLHSQYAFNSDWKECWVKQ